MGAPGDRRVHYPTSPLAKPSWGLVTEPEAGEKIKGKWGHLLVDIPPGDNYLYYTAQRGHSNPIFEWRSRYWSFLLKLSPDRPSPTIPVATRPERWAVPLGEQATSAS